MIIKYYVTKARAEGDGKGTYLRLNSFWRRKIYLPVYKMFGDLEDGLKVAYYRNVNQPLRRALDIFPNPTSSFCTKNTLLHLFC